MRIDELSQSLTQRPPERTEKSSKEEFLRLLVAQLEHQNPLEPQSGAEFVAQLAQFASLEQTEATNDLLSSVHAEQVSAASASMAGFIGKEARFDGGNMTVDDPGRGLPGVSFELSEGLSDGTAVVVDAQGKVVRELPLGPLAPGEHSLRWDGKDKLGQAVPPGTYHVEVRGGGEGGEKKTISTTVSGLVESIDFSNGYPMMRIGGALFAPGDVLSIGKGE